MNEGAFKTATTSSNSSPSTIINQKTNFKNYHNIPCFWLRSKLIFFLSIVSFFLFSFIYTLSFRYVFFLTTICSFARPQRTKIAVTSCDSATIFDERNRTTTATITKQDHSTIPSSQRHNRHQRKQQQRRQHAHASNPTSHSCVHAQQQRCFVH